MDREILVEKLIQVEVANKRAMDLTRRLAAVENEIEHAKKTLADLKRKRQK